MLDIALALGSVSLMELLLSLDYYPPITGRGSARRRRWLRDCSRSRLRKRHMAATVSTRHVWLSQLEVELLRARELETAGKERVDGKKNELQGPKIKTSSVLNQSGYLTSCARRTNFKPAMCVWLKTKFWKDSQAETTEPFGAGIGSSYCFRRGNVR